MFRKLKNKIEDFLQAQGIKIIQKRIVKGWDVADYFDDIFIPAIKAFCVRGLRDRELVSLNPYYKKVYSNTLNLINKADWSVYSNPNDKNKEKARIYITRHLDYFWN